MPKTKISEFDVDPANNTDINSINIAEGCAPSGINNAIRQLMSDLKEFQTGAGGDPFNGAVNGTVGATTPAAGTFTSLTDSGNLTFTGTGNRITGDFSNATIANRVLFQTSTTNGNTSVALIPNGTSVNSNLVLYNNSSITNSSRMYIGVGSTEATITSDITGTGTYLPLTMYTGGSERLRIDTSGNVGIGTSSPNQRLESTGTIRVSRAGTPTTFMEFFGGDGSVDPRINVPSGFGIPFNIGGSEKARIDSSGNLLVGTTANAGVGGFTVAPNSTEGAAQVNFNRNSTTNGSTVIVFRNAGTAVGSISYTNSTTTYSTSSDYRLKENIAPMTGALATVAALKPVTYKWKVDGSDGQGFIAHELAEVVPDCVTGEKDAVDEEGKPVYQGIDTSFLVATLTASIQELKAIVDAQAVRITALENK